MKTFFSLALTVMLAFCSMFGLGTKIEKEKYYCDTYFFDSGTSWTYEYETIYFDSYTVSDIYITNGVPNYTNYTQLNSCAPMAGSIVIGYYDTFCPNLIENFASSYIYNGQFYYRNQNAYVNNMKEYLYELMGTNTINPGTSVSQFTSGLQQYVEDQGYDITYNTCGTNLNISTANSYLSNDIPVALFLDSYVYIPLGSYSFTDNSMYLQKRVSSNGHVAIAQGYREYNFYNSGVLFRTDKYMIIAFGNGTKGLLNVNDITTVDTAIAISIY